MKFLFLLFSFFLGQGKNLFKQQSTALTEQIVLNVRSLAVITLSSVGALALFCSGFYMLLSNIATQIDATGELHITATFVVGLLLTIGSLGTLVYCLKASTWLSATGFAKKPAREQSRGSGSPVEAAIATLIMDFVREREQSRQRQGHAHSDAN